ncbi:heme-binding protein [bacterium]|nr:heme-binding protein [bacterium]
MVRKRMIIWVMGSVVLFVALFFGWKLMSRSAYESAEYTVVEAESPFEVREYPDLMMATTSMPPLAKEEDGSFMRLFGYISGDNSDKQKIAMTTPVFMESNSQAEPGQMGFVLPKEVAERHVPEPSGQNVKLRKRDGGRFAVIVFTGQINASAIAAAESRLRAWMKERGLTGEARAELAGYDPPWTPGPLRRNEVLIRLMP